MSAESLSIHLILTSCLLAWSIVTLLNGFSMRLSMWRSVQSMVSLKHLNKTPEMYSLLASRVIQSKLLITVITSLILAGLLIICVAFSASLVVQVGVSLIGVSVPILKSVIIAGYVVWTVFWLCFLLADVWFYIWLTNPVLQVTHLAMFGIGAVCLSNI